MHEVHACRDAYPDHYVRVNGYDASLGRQTTALSFIVNRPDQEPGFRLDRQEGSDRRIRYSLQAYAAPPRRDAYGRNENRTAPVTLGLPADERRDGPGRERIRDAPSRPAARLE